MKKKTICHLFVLSTVLSSCFSLSNEEKFVVQGLSAKKHRQKIMFLKKKLQRAEKESQKAQDEVEKLTEEMYRSQLALIQKQVDEVEMQEEKKPRLFLEERAILTQMIQSGPSPVAFDAQVELDRILRIVTEFDEMQGY